LTFVSNAGACMMPFTPACFLGTIPAGESRQITTTFAVPSGYSTPNPISNTSTVTTTVADQDPTDNVATATTVVNPPSADLSIMKSGEAAARPGDSISYVVTVANLGPGEAQGVVVNDPTPAGLTFVSNSGACITPFPCSLGTLAFGETRSIIATFAVNANAAPGAIVNTATVSSSTPDPSSANNTAQFPSPISDITVGLADLALTKTASVGSVQPDGSITYVLVATNLGPDEASDVAIEDATPPGTIFVSASPSPGGACTAPTPARPTVRCVWPALTAVGPDAARRVTLVVRVAANAANGTRILNTGEVTTPTTDSTPENNSAFALTNVYVGGPSADIEVQKVLTVGAEPGGALPVPVGQPFTYWMKVINHGPENASGIVVADLLPSSFVPLSASATQGSFNMQTGVWTVGDLPPGGVAVLDLTVSAMQTGSVQNTLVRIESQPVDPNASNDVSSGTFIVGAQSDIEVRGAFRPSLRSAHLVDAAHPNVTMRFEVRNTGAVPMTATRLQGALRTADGQPALIITNAVASQGTIDAAASAWDVGPLAPGASAFIDVTATVTRAVRMQLEMRRMTTIPADVYAGNDRAVLTLDGVSPNAGARYVAFGNTRGTPTAELIVGAGELESPRVQIFDATGVRTLSFAAYDPRILGGVRVAACDVNRDGRDEIVTAAALPDGGPHVRLFSRRPDDSIDEVASWYAIGRDYRGGVHVACGDVDGDGAPEVVTGSGAEGPAIIQIWKPTLSTGTAQEVARGTLGDIAPGFGVRVATCDVTGDGRAEVLAAAAGGSLPIVRIFDVASARLLHSFPAAQPGEALGLQIACGDVLPGGSNEIVVGFDLGGSPLARVFTREGTFLGEYLGFAPRPGASVRVAVGEFDGDPAVQEFALSSGLDASAQVLVGSARAGVTILLRLVAAADQSGQPDSTVTPLRKH
jgi:uncharacterized repeat protein (TIGR01451 family)